MKRSLLAQLLAPSFIIPSENAGRRYHELVDPITSDKRGRIIPAYGVRLYVLDLTTARNMVSLGLKGDVWFCDYNSTGVATIQNNNTSEGAMPALALAGMGNLPFDDLFITHAAQPGLILNLWVGYGADFIAPTSAIATIGSITNAVKVQGPRGMLSLALLADQPVQVGDWGYPYGTSFKSSTALVAATSETVLAAGSNVNGLIIHAQGARGVNVTAGAVHGLGVHTAAPNGLTVGDVLCLSNNSNFTALFDQASELKRAVRVAAGKGIFHTVVGQSETTGNRYANYTNF